MSTNYHSSPSIGYPPATNSSVGLEGQNPISKESKEVQMAAEGFKGKSLKSYRRAIHSHPYRKTGKAKSCFRFIFCFLFLGVIMFVGIVCTLAMWLRPPVITYYGYDPPSNLTVNQGAFSFQVAVHIGIKNQNFIGATFKSIEAEGFLQNHNTTVGYGQLRGVRIPTFSNTTVTFPIEVKYNLHNDTNLAMLTDIATRCGFIGSQTQDITVDYKLNLRLSILSVVVHPNFSGSTNFDCPLSRQDLINVIGDNLSGILGSLGSGGLGSLIGSII